MSTKPPTLAFDLDRDLRALATMASNLTPYLYEDEMYGFLSGDLPNLTLGGLLLRLYRLGQLENSLDADQQTMLQDARINFEAECAKWAVHYESKLQHELHARLDAFDQFLNECGDDLQSCAANYPVQAEKRTIIEHLTDELKELEALPDEIEGRIRHIDQRLRRLLHEGDFITDERLEAAYPKDRFWWMYGYLPENAR